MIEDIKKFEFWFGNSFCGIKKMLIIFGENFSVHSNGHNKKNNLIETEILKKINDIEFSKWADQYTTKNPNFDNSWTITLTYSNKQVIYRGVDAYPTDWEKVLEIAEEYGGFDIEKDFGGDYDE